MVVNEKQPDFYLAAMDTHRVTAPVEAWRVKSTMRDGRTSDPSVPRKAAVREDYLLIRVEPPFDVRGKQVDMVLLSVKGEPVSWAAIDRWPVFIYLLNPKVADIESRDLLGDDEFEVLDWAALFPNKEEASRFL